MVDLKKRSLVFDIETFTPTGKPDPNQDILRYVGFRLPTGKKLIFHASQREAIQNILSMYPILVGHNIKTRSYNSMDMGYDVKVMERHGYTFKTSSGDRHILVDTQEIIEKRARSMMYLDFGRGQMNLRYLANFFDLPVKKGDFDFRLLAKPMLVGEELREMKEYLEGDLDTTYHLYEYLYDFFSGFMEFMKPDDVNRMKWLTSSSGANAYKIICHQAGLPELYRDNIEGLATVKYKGGFVALPYMDHAEGNIYCIDFASLYPHMFMGGNLYSPVKEGVSGWTGGEVYGVGEDAINGTYDSTPGKIEKTIRRLFNTRVKVKKEMKQYDRNSEEWKTRDRKQLAIKITINTMYGISGSPLFISVYNLTTASDCTAMSRRSIKHAREILNKHGYECLYTDTDSVYVRDPFDNEEGLKSLCKAISKKQIASFNIPIDTHDFEIENKITRMWFFRNDKGKFNKKHYIYELEDGRVKEKGIKIVKGDCSKLAKETYKRFIKPHLLASGDDFFVSPSQLLTWIKSVAEGDYTLLTRRYRVNSITTYKSTSSIQAQIAFKYGPGEHYLVPNIAIGVGKAKHYAKIEELQKALGDRWLDAVIYAPFMNELKNFIHVKDRKRIGK